MNTFKLALALGTGLTLSLAAPHVYADPIIIRNADYIRNGGTFLVPLPVAKKIDKHGATALD